LCLLFIFLFVVEVGKLSRAENRDKMSDRDSVVTVDELDETGEEQEIVEKGEETKRGQDRESRTNRWGSSGGYERRDAPYGPGGELGTKILHIQSKKFYIDLKDSRRGRFLKISEIALNGQKNRMTMEVKSAVELTEKLTDFIQEYSKLGPRSSSGEGSRMTKIKSETIFATERRYYLDLKDNRMGRFLKIAMTMPPPNFDRSEIVIPAQGMVDLRDAIADLINEFGGDGEGVKIDSGDKCQSSGDSKDRSGGKDEGGLTLKTDNKTFRAAVLRNSHGIHLKISEICPKFRTAINVPYEHWGRFLELLKKNATAGSTNGGEAGAQASAMEDDI